MWLISVSFRSRKQKSFMLCWHFFFLTLAFVDSFFVQKNVFHSHFTRAFCSQMLFSLHFVGAFSVDVICYLFFFSCWYYLFARCAGKRYVCLLLGALCGVFVRYVFFLFFSYTIFVIWYVFVKNDLVESSCTCFFYRTHCITASICIMWTNI